MSVYVLHFKQFAFAFFCLQAQHAKEIGEGDGAGL